MKSLVDGINSGDLTSAKAAFDALQKQRQGAGATSSSSSGTSQRDQDIAAIGKALDSGDADAAKQALAKLQDDRKNAAGAGRAQGAHAAHHHGHRMQSAGGPAAGTAQDTPITYGASASTAQAAAPGSIIDVTA
jgi:hypothetical protein